MSANLPKIYAKPMLTFWTNWPCSVFELFFFVSCSYFLGPLARNRWKWKVLLWKWKCMYDNETELKTHCHHEWQMSWFIKVYPCKHNTELKLCWVYLVFAKDGGKFGVIIRRPDWCSVDIQQNLSRMNIKWCCYLKFGSVSGWYQTLHGKPWN